MSSTHRTRMPEGIEIRHKSACRSRQGGGCTCIPSYRGKVTAVKNWRTDQLAAINHGRYVTPTEVTLRGATADFIEGAHAGHVLNRKGQPYKPSVVRDYEGGPSAASSSRRSATAG